MAAKAQGVSDIRIVDRSRTWRRLPADGGRFGGIRGNSYQVAYTDTGGQDDCYESAIGHDRADAVDAYGKDGDGWQVLERCSGEQGEFDHKQIVYAERIEVVEQEVQKRT